MVTLFGIKNCDTVKKARRWLDTQAVDYRFHDVRADGLSAKQLQHWERELGWEHLLNRRGTTWRKLPESVREAIDRRSAIKLMLEHPALIKRPVLEIDAALHLGFNEKSWETLFG